MGLFDWLKGGKKPKAPTDPVRAFEERIDALTGRAGALRKSAATLLTVRRDLDRKLEACGKQLETAKAQAERARGSGDEEAASVLAGDHERFEREREHLKEQRDKVAGDAQALADAVRSVESEVEELKRERDSARVRMATADVFTRTRPAMEERIDQLLQLDQARDEIERAHALAEIYREDAARKGRS